MDLFASVSADLIARSFSRLSHRTAVEDVLQAGRDLDGRRLPDEPSTSRLLFVFPDMELFETVMSWSLEQLAVAYRCPEASITEARRLDPDLTESALTRITQARFRPRFESGPPGDVRRFLGETDDWRELRVLVIEDEPHVLDLVAPPLVEAHHILVTSLREAWNGAVGWYGEEELARRSPPHHVVSGDGVKDVLEALAYHACGYELRGGSPGEESKSFATH